MKRTRIQFAAPRAALPTLDKPFAVLLDANDPEWSDANQVERLATDFLNAGCNYFVCFGPGSEALHDRIDAIIEEHEVDGVTTTFHEEETRTDVAEFFRTIATVAVRSGLICVRDVAGWNTAL
jgi:hypothetical protein